MFLKKIKHIVVLKNIKKFHNWKKSSVNKCATFSNYIGFIVPRAFKES